MAGRGEDAWRRFVGTLGEGARPPFPEHWSAFREAYEGAPAKSPPPFAWWPDAAVEETSNLASLMREVGVQSYAELHRFTVEHREEFWSRVVSRLGVVFEETADDVLNLDEGVENPGWFRGARLDVTRSCFTADADRVAIVFGRERTGALETLSYGDLERGVNRFANGLRENGFATHDAVALYMPMTPECVVAYLGTVRAGCRVVSVADSFSAEELRTRMEIAGARAVVALSGYERAGRTIELYPKVREALTGLKGESFAILLEAEELEGRDMAWEDFVSANGEDASFIAEPDHVTNVLFSSGTTGTPKAIPWTQLTPLKAAMDGHFHQDIHPEDVVCWPTNVGWMMGPWLVYASLVNEATMALYEGAPAGEGFTRFVRDASVNVLGVVPSMVRNWREKESAKPGDWPNVRVFSSTGEASNSEDYLWLMSLADYRAPVIEYLGGTEIGGGHLTGSVLQPASPATFTTPALGTEFLILNEEGEPVGDGEMGELFLIPPALGISQTLLNKDHHEAYYADCPAGPNGEVLRRHGDQIARLPHGYYKAQGRADDTMNLGGIKVSSIELERVIDEHPAVYESAAVAVQTRGEGADALVVYVVTKGEPERETLGKELSRAIGKRLNPLFKIREVVAIDALPRTASNKIMRRTLRALYTESEA